MGGIYTTLTNKREGNIHSLLRRVDKIALFYRWGKRTGGREVGPSVLLSNFDGKGNIEMRLQTIRIKLKPKILYGRN